MKRLHGSNSPRASTASVKRSRTNAQRTMPLADVVKTIDAAARAPSVAQALASYDKRELKGNAFPASLEAALLNAADRINAKLSAKSPARLSVNQVYTRLGSDVALPASLENLSSRGGDPITHAFTPGDIYLGFAKPRDQLLNRALASSPEKIPTSYIDPVVFAWILEKGLTGKRRALWFFQQSRRDGVEHAHVRERSTNGVSELLNAFNAYVLALAPGPADKIRRAVADFVSATTHSGPAAETLNVLVKRLCKTFIEFKVQQGHTIHLATDNVAWETVGIKGHNDPQVVFTPSELKRLARLPHSKTKFYMEGKAIEAPTGMQKLRGMMRERRSRQT